MEIDEAQARFSWVLELVEAGQEITLTRACRQVVRLAPYVNGGRDLDNQGCSAVESGWQTTSRALRPTSKSPNSSRREIRREAKRAVGI